MRISDWSSDVCSSDLTSCAEAWIETSFRISGRTATAVASCAEAWIETSPSRRSWLNINVASCAGAWIETRTDKRADCQEGEVRNTGRGEIAGQAGTCCRLEASEIQKKYN